MRLTWPHGSRKRSARNLRHPDNRRTWMREHRGAIERRSAARSGKCRQSRRRMRTGGEALAAEQSLPTDPIPSAVDERTPSHGGPPRTHVALRTDRAPRIGFPMAGLAPVNVVPSAGSSILPASLHAGLGRRVAAGFFQLHGRRRVHGELGNVGGELVRAVEDLVEGDDLPGVSCHPAH